MYGVASWSIIHVEVPACLVLRFFVINCRFKNLTVCDGDKFSRSKRHVSEDRGKVMRACASSV